MGLHDILQPRLVELGKIKIGGKGEERIGKGGRKWRTPVSYDHFIITTLNRDSSDRLECDTHLMKSLAEEGYGDDDGNLRRIPIHLMSNDIDDVMQSAYVWYDGKKCLARSDGKTVEWFYDVKEYEKSGGKTQRLNTPVISEWKDSLRERKDVKFKLHTVFNCIIASNQARWGGVYKFRTTGIISSEQLLGSMVQLKKLTYGILVGLPLQMIVRPMQVAPDGIVTTKYFVHVELRGTDMLALQDNALRIAQHQAQHAQQMEEAKSQYRALLAAPGEETDEHEIEDIIAEFVPMEPDNDPEPEEPKKKSGNRLKEAMGITQPEQDDESALIQEEPGSDLGEDELL